MALVTFMLAFIAVKAIGTLIVNNYGERKESGENTQHKTNEKRKQENKAAEKIQKAWRKFQVHKRRRRRKKEKAKNEEKSLKVGMACRLKEISERNPEDLEFIKILGEGGFGMVLHYRCRVTNTNYAVKLCTRNTEDDIAENERAILQQVSSNKFCCKLLGTFPSQRSLVLVLEYLQGGDMAGHINALGKFPEELARFFAAEIICGLEFLYVKGIIHRDIKPENVLLSAEGHAKISDFGLATMNANGTRGIVGTLPYMAPEMLDNEPYDCSVDWWAFGIMLFVMLTGQLPFYSSDQLSVISFIREPFVHYEMAEKAHASKLGVEAKDCLRNGCKAVGSLLSVPPLAVLCGVQGVLSFALAHAEVQVPDTMLREPGLLWLAIGMPIGTGKSIIYKYLVDLLKNVRERLAEDKISFSDYTFEQLGELLFITEPKTAQSLITGNNNNSAPHFLWVFPRPVFQGFDSLKTDVHRESCDAAREFTVLLEDILILIFKAKASAQDQDKVTYYSIEITEKRVFPKAYDECQKILENNIQGDQFLCATYSEAKSQYLCMSLPFHALFLSRPLPDALPALIPEDAQQAAISLVKLCIQHAQLFAGRNIHSLKILLSFVE
ncbi:uncharacterized protein LOC144640687 isoform X2 [Oculina patagonica]